MISSNERGVPWKHSSDRQLPRAGWLRIGRPPGQQPGIGVAHYYRAIQPPQPRHHFGRLRPALDHVAQAYYLVGRVLLQIG